MKHTNEHELVAIEKLLNSLITKRDQSNIKDIEVKYIEYPRSSGKYELNIKVNLTFPMPKLGHSHEDEVNLFENYLSDIDWAITEALKYIGSPKYFIEFNWPNE